MRTDDEILARIAEVAGRDFFGFERNDLITRLPFEKATAFLKAGAPADKWNQEPRDRDAVIAEMLGYMPFAWEKANNERGISASRSMSHFNAWTWLAGDDFDDLTEYEFYGKDNLVMLCEKYGWDAKQWDDGRRVNSAED